MAQNVIYGEKSLYLTLCDDYSIKSNKFNTEAIDLEKNYELKFETIGLQNNKRKIFKIKQHPINDDIICVLY